MPRIAYVNGDFVPLEDARISVLDRGFLFADGIYEVTAVLDGRLIDYANHAARLRRSLDEIKLVAPVTAQQLSELHVELVRRNDLSEGVVYLQITRGVADRDFLFPAPPVPTLVMFTQQKDIIHAHNAKNGIAVLSAPDLRWARCDIKSVGLLAQVLAKQAAAAAGCQEVWMIRDGTVTEGGSSTPFIITAERKLVTRPLSHEILPGITRKAVLELVESTDLELQERAFTLAEAYAAMEAFNTSASSLVTPVVSLDGNKIGDGVPGPLAKELRRLYIEAALQGS